MLKKGINIVKSMFKLVSILASSIVNFILLFIVYLLGIGPVSIIAKIFGKHFLDLKNCKKKSNWHEHKVTKQPIEQYYQTF